MKLSLLGISHKTAPVEIREKFSIPDSKLEETLSSIVKLPGIANAILISTCNRTETYIEVSDINQALSNLKKFFCQMSGLGPEKLNGYLYSQEGLSVIDQIMRVASGLDSMIVGEGQVLGQVKTSFEKARQAKFSGPVLNTLFNRAISAGKRARAETEISIGAVSISSTAVELARKIFEDLSEHQVLIIGAGKMSELAARHLISYGLKTVFVSNRTFEKAQELALKFQGEAVKFDALSDYLCRVDIVISSTGAPHLLLRKEEVAEIMAKRNGKPIFFIDIAVPRDIAPEAGELEDVFLYDIDDLGGVMEENKREREKEIPKVEKIIEEEKQRFIKWYNSRKQRPKEEVKQ